MNRVTVLFIFVGFEVDLIKANACVTPYKEHATCIPTFQCASVVSALSTLTAQALQFAQDSQCGCEPGFVCCGTSNNKPYRKLVNCVPVPELIKIDLSQISDRSVCGLDATTDRITGGETAKPEEFPWLAALEYTNKFTKENAGIRCGGSIINKRYVLTAAHCIFDIEFEVIKVWLGVTNITSEEFCLTRYGKFQCIKTVQKLSVAKTIPHELYDTINKGNDIGLLQLEDDIDFTDYIRPICLPSADSESPNPGIRLTVAGWGVTEHGRTSQVKLKVQVPLRNHQICERYLSQHHRNITAKQFCVGGESGKDACQGDSGGPLMYDFQGVNNDVQWYQQGIVSYGTGCGIQGKPAVYTKVSSYIGWISNKIQNRNSGLDQDEPCISQNNNTGQCIPLKTCPSILKNILTKSEYYSLAYDVFRLRCDYGAIKNPLICCENPGSIMSHNFNTINALPDQRTCGIIKEESGRRNDLSDFPWMAGIEVFTGQVDDIQIKCMGTVINNRYVLTTVPCIFGRENHTFEPISVWLGRWNSYWNNGCRKSYNARRCNNDMVQKIGIQKIIPYPLSGSYVFNDNALILLKNEIIFSDYISSICLSSRNLPKLEVGSRLTVTRVLNSSRTESINSSGMINEELSITKCSPIRWQKDSDSHYCQTGASKLNYGTIIPGAPLMQKFEDKQSGRMQWYLVAISSWNLNEGYATFAPHSISDSIEWIVNIISEYS